MLRNKFNLFLLNLILFLLNSSATNESSEEKYDAVDSEYTLSEDTNFLEGNNKERHINVKNNEKIEGTTCKRSILEKKKLKQINDCQKKLFRNEVGIKREYNLDPKTQKRIITDYINENLEFKQAYGRYQKTCNTKNDIETEINYIEAKKKHIKLVNNLNKLFNGYKQTPEEFYNLKLNKKYSENTKNMVSRKVKEFIENYINGQLNVAVGRLVLN
uniref:Uncharacterized protein n=1 Tax=Meloidogyne floridensis TaxID=298350 RepID=A0A915PB87_9BILA